MSYRKKNYRLNIPQASALAKSLRYGGATLEGLAIKYDVPSSRIRQKLNDAGYSSVTGESNVIPIRHRDTPLILSAGGSANYVGGGDNDRGLPTTRVIYGTPKPRPTGLDWEAMRPCDEPVTKSPPEVHITRSGHTFAVDPYWTESLRDASRHRYVPGSSESSSATNHTSSGSQPYRGDPGSLKLTEQQRAEIVHRYKLGESAEALARAFNVSRKLITRMLEHAGIQLRSRSEAMRLVSQ